MSRVGHKQSLCSPWCLLLVIAYIAEQGVDSSTSVSMGFLETLVSVRRRSCDACRNESPRPRGPYVSRRAKGKEDTAHRADQLSPAISPRAVEHTSNHQVSNDAEVARSGVGHPLFPFISKTVSSTIKCTTPVDKQNTSYIIQRLSSSSQTDTTYTAFEPLGTPIQLKMQKHSEVTSAGLVNSFASANESIRWSPRHCGFEGKDSNDTEIRNEPFGTESEQPPHPLVLLTAPRPRWRQSNVSSFWSGSSYPIIGFMCMAVLILVGIPVLLVVILGV